MAEEFAPSSMSLEEEEEEEQQLDFRPIPKIDFSAQVSMPSASWEARNYSLCFCDQPTAKEKSTQITSPEALPKKKKTSGSQTPTPPNSLNFENMEERQIKAFCGVDHRVIKLLVLRASLSETRKLTAVKKIILLLIRLKLQVSFPVLAAFFDVSETTAKNAFKEALNEVFAVAKENLIWFDRDTVQARMPPSFKALFPNTRAIIDCSEVPCERASSVRQRVQTYSYYKSRFTLKFLVAISPSGEIMFLSKVYGGRATDTEITCNSGFLDLIEDGDVILADKGFPVIDKNMSEVGGILVMPPFKKGNRQFSQKELSDGFKCASVRVHVERAIARLKIFECMNFVPVRNIPHFEKCLVIVSFLTNLSPDLIRVSAE